MRRAILFGLVLLFCSVPGTKVRALVSGAANIAKENGYAVLAPPPGADIAKENGYAVLAPPAGALIAKMNAYAIVQKRLPTVQIIE